MIFKRLSVLFFSSFFLHACSYYPELDINVKDLEIEETFKFVKISSSDAATEAVIMYPGGLVDPYAYVDLLDGLVSGERAIFIAKVPSNLAVLNVNVGQEIIRSFPEIDNWSIMGHSLGGAMACSEVSNHLDSYNHLILLGAYPAASVDLKDYDGRVLSLYASEDAFSTKEKIDNSKSQFQNAVEILEIDEIDVQSTDTYFYEIQGGNHSYFGSYGMQNGDGVATISRAMQHQIIIDFTKQLLND